MLLNGKPFNPGELRTPVTLYSPTITVGASGAQKVTYTTSQGSVWAKWKNAFGAESVSGDAKRGVKRATVTIRYRADITLGWAVLLGSDLYEILSLDDIENRHEYIEMQAQSVRGTV
jgi:SPP1 family predicted phage head-tail adaptor